LEEAPVTQAFNDYTLADTFKAGVFQELAELPQNGFPCLVISELMEGLYRCL
jgi:hypothetical protein